MKTLKIAITFILAVLLLAPAFAEAAITFPVNGGTGSSTLSGILKGNGTSPVQTAVSGTDYTLITGASCANGYHISAITAAGVATCSVDTGGSGATSLATTSPWTALQLVQVKDNGTVTSIATSSLGLLTTNVAEGTNLYFTNARAQAAISVSGVPLTYSSGVIGINQANGSQAGYLSSSDWTTFNGKQAALTFSYPILNSANTISLAFGTTTSNTWGGTQTFTNAPVLASLTGLVGANSGSLYQIATSTLTAGSGLSGSFTQIGSSGSLSCATANGSTFGCLTAADWTTFNGKQATLSATWPITLTGATIGFNGLSTSTAAVVGNIPYFSGVNTFANVATSSLAVSSSFSYSGTLGSLVGGTGGTLSIASGGVSNAMLANSTISGVSLGGTLFSHTHNATLNGTSYNGSAAVSDWGLNLGNANTWTALQQFGNASTSLLSSYGPSYFGATATSSFSTAGTLSLVNGSVGTPALNVGDAATGLFRAALNTLDWAINGVEKMTLNSTGLGVGSTSPSTMLSVGTPSTPGTILSAEYQPATSTSMTIDFKNGNQQLVRTGTAATTIAFSNAFPGTSLRLIVCNPNASAGALTFSGVDWVGGTAPTQTTTANQCDVWSFLVSGATSTAKIFGAASAGFQ